MQKGPESLARKVLDLAAEQGLLEPKVIAELRQRVSESKFIITPEAIAKVLVDHGHLTPFQARKLVGQALGPEPEPEPRRRSHEPEEELTFADPADLAEQAANRAPAEEDEIVELEAVAPPPQPAKPAGKVSVRRQAPAAPSTAPAEPVKAKKKERAPAPAVGDDDLAGLGPAEPSGKWKGESRTSASARPAAKSAVQPAAKTTAAPAAAPAGVAELDEGLMPLDAMESTGAEQSAGPLAPVGKKAKKNVWDSPLILVGGGLLGVLMIAFLALLYALTRGTAAEAFNKVEEEYKSGNYGVAIEGYQRFLDQYSSNPNASLARVRLGLAQLHQVTDDGRNPGLALQTAKEVLPEIEKEQKSFGEARPELAAMLPEIADGFASQAERAGETARKEELVKLAGEAMQLVNNPSYLPASLRKEREGRIAAILDKLKAAQRSIDQDKELITAIGKIKGAAEKGNAREAYSVRDTLVRTYPALEVNPQLIAAIAGVGERERQLVKVASGGEPPTNDEPPAAAISRVIVAVREGPATAASAGQPVFVLVEGSVYGLDGANGRVLWRRFVGYETVIGPTPLPAGDSADALIVDSRSRELLRVGGATGQLVWRQALNDSATPPLVLGERVVVTTRGGRVIALEAATGNVLHAAQLPQQASVAPGVGGQSRLYQLGEHSTLFVLNADTLECTETVYLGHKAGAVFVPPVSVFGMVLFVESPADDYSLVHVLAPDAKTKRLAAVGRPFRLSGRVLAPPALKGRGRVAVVTDLGQIAVYEADAANAQQPVRLLAGQQASETAPLMLHLAFDGNRLWTAGKRCVSLEVQGALQQLNRKWSANQDDLFIGPLHVQGETLVHCRRTPGGGAVLVEGVSAETGRPQWTTHLASPIVALAVSESRRTVDVLTGEGRLFSLSAEQLRAGYVDSPTFSPPPGSGGAILPEASLSPDQSQLVWTEARPGGSVYGYNVAGGGSPSSAPLPTGAQAAAAAQPLG
ncbi:MAG TPA: PQQ-binding-like beta-propeller repeat protein, partial [Pirellulaceae bacterium]|nr:PQQ-binding-like beta-propeller repeat protein [Pirellulaceae bacterium]